MIIALIISVLSIWLHVRFLYIFMIEYSRFIRCYILSSCLVAGNHRTMLRVLCCLVHGVEVTVSVIGVSDPKPNGILQKRGDSKHCGCLPAIRN